MRKCGEEAVAYRAVTEVRTDCSAAVKKLQCGGR